MKSFTEHPSCVEAVKSEGNTSCVFCRLRMDWQNQQAGDVYINPRDTICPLGFKLGEAPKVVIDKSKVKPNSLPIGDLVSKVAKPIARVIDSVIGTNLEGCSACEKRRRALNKVGKAIVDSLPIVNDNKP